MHSRLSRSFLVGYSIHVNHVLFSDHVEGQAIIASRNAHFEDDGVIDKREKKELEAAQKRQLHNRQRGIAGLRPYRTAQWMKQGIKSRLMPKKSSSKRDRECELLLNACEANFDRSHC